MMKKNLLADFRKSFLPHAVSAHFSNGLIPVAVFFLILFLPSGDPFFERTVEHLLLVSTVFIPVSFVTGVIDWKKIYNGAKAPIFVKKIRLSILLFAVGVVASLIRLFNPDVLHAGGFLSIAYAAMLFLMLAMVTMLGFYGGKLSAAQRQASARK